jgi:hypothetical protein
VNQWCAFTQFPSSNNPLVRYTKGTIPGISKETIVQAEDTSETASSGAPLESALAASENGWEGPSHSKLEGPSTDTRANSQ